MNFRYIWLIARREYLQRLRSLTFILGTALGGIGILALAFLPLLISVLERQSTLKIAVVDPQRIISPYLPENVSDQSGNTPTTTSGGGLAGGRISPESLFTGLRFIKTSTTDTALLSKQVLDGQINAYLVISGTHPSNIALVYHSKDRPTPAISARLLAALTTAVAQARLQASNISPDQLQAVQAIFSPPTLRVEPVEQGTLKDEKAFLQSAAVVYLLLVLLYVTILMYGMQVATGVVEEKSSRVMELLVSAVRPIDLMLGKVLGVAITGLTQYGVWIIVGLILLTVNALSGNLTGPAVMNIEYVPAEILVFFVVFFLLGFLLYALVYAGVGSLVSRNEDINSIATPLTMIIVLTYVVSILAIGSPDAPLVRWLSFIPFFTPMLMFIRVALSSPAWWEPVLSILILLATSLLLAWVSAKIYRVGVLMYGKRPSLREVVRLLGAS